MIPGKRYTPELALAIGWRRKWLILIPAVLVATLACGVTYFLPDLYRSEASILVVPQRVPEAYVKSPVTTKLDDRLRSISEQVRSRTKLERIIEELNLYAERRKAGILQDVVDEMSDNISVRIVQGDVFKIAFTSDNARTALLVTERLTSFIIDESLKDRAQIAEEAGEFLEGEALRAERKLRETEQKLQEYKRRHDGELPTQVDANQYGLSNAQSSLMNVAQTIEQLRDQQLQYQKQIPDLTQLADAAAAAPVSVQDAPKTKAGQLDVARAQLQTLLATKGNNHPNVVRLQDQIAILEREAAAEAASQTTLGPRQTANPMLAKRLQDLEDAKENLRRVTVQIDRQIGVQAALQQRVEEFQRRMQAAPVRDTELIALTRDYALHQSSYESLSAKRIDSNISANLERGQIGEQFRILDQARLPEKPFSPNRPRLYLMSIILAIAVGLGAAAAAEYLDRGLRSEDDVRLALALPVLAAIPVIGAPKKKSPRGKALAGSAAAAVLTAAAGAAWNALR